MKIAVAAATAPCSPLPHFNTKWSASALLKTNHTRPTSELCGRLRHDECPTMTRVAELTHRVAFRRSTRAFALFSVAARLVTFYSNARGVSAVAPADAASFVADPVVSPLQVHPVVSGGPGGPGPDASRRRLTTYAPFVYLGGPVMRNVSVYSIWYGSWNASAVQILKDMVRKRGRSGCQPHVSGRTRDEYSPGAGDGDELVDVARHRDDVL